jgi:hypothetical protein
MRKFQQTEVTYEYDNLLLSSTLKKSLQCFSLKFIPKLRPFNLIPEITCPLNTFDIFDVFLITPQSFLARLNLLINLQTYEIFEPISHLQQCLSR